MTDKSFWLNLWRQTYDRWVPLGAGWSTAPVVDGTEACTFSCMSSCCLPIGTHVSRIWFRTWESQWVGWWLKLEQDELSVTSSCICLFETSMLLDSLRLLSAFRKAFCSCAAWDHSEIRSLRRVADVDFMLYPEAGPKGSSKVLAGIVCVFSCKFTCQIR